MIENLLRFSQQQDWSVPQGSSAFAHAPSTLVILIARKVNNRSPKTKYTFNLDILSLNFFYFIWISFFYFEFLIYNDYKKKDLFL